MGMAQPYTDWTADKLALLPDDGNRYEVIDGELFVTPAPGRRHQRALAELYLLIGPYAKAIGLDALFAPTAVRFSEQREVQPDLLVMPCLADGRPAALFEDVGVLTLAVEVLSPYSVRTDRFTKRALYQAQRVPEYWIVDCDERTVERWTPDAGAADVRSDALVWQPLPTHAPLVIDLAQYFDEVLR